MTTRYVVRLVLDVAASSRVSCWRGASGAASNRWVSSQTPPSGQDPTSTSNSDAPEELTIDAIRKLPGYLRGPLGQRAMRAVGEEEWVEYISPKHEQPVWKNTKTGEMTGPGLPKPDTWTQVLDRSSGLFYYWNRRTGDVTTPGESKPRAYARPTWLTSAPSSPPASPKADIAPEDKGLTWSQSFQSILGTFHGKVMAGVIVAGTLYEGARAIGVL